MMDQRHSILLQLVCAALQGGMSPADVYEQMYEDAHTTGLWDIAKDIGNITFDEEEEIIKPKPKYDY